jgi:NADH-ubiquinone oxidoreductase chain 5
MAAPTPVSSLVHSSTLVTAGVYVLFRLSQRIPSESLAAIMLIGCLTIRLARLAALSEIDMKKIVALSTLSQLGLIITIIGAGSPRLAFFHLLSHAYFKALLFIRVGNLIHLSSGVQDLRILFTGKSGVALTPRVAILANLSLMGTPFMAGFYSKDSILERRVLGSYSLVFILLLLGSVVLTAAYRVRFLVLAS